MSQHLETLKFSRMYLNAANATQQGLNRIVSHLNRAYGSFKTTPKHPLSDDAAKALVNVENKLNELRVALDAAHIQVSGDIGYFAARIQAAEAALKAE